jgi:hypothetical protein
MNDLYLLQPFVTFNSYPVYVGHTHGKYIYYYDPVLGSVREQHLPGWCISPHLGCGASDFQPAPPFSAT